MKMFRPEQLDVIARNYYDIIILRSIAEHPNTSAETLEYIIGYPIRVLLSVYVRKHPNTPDYIKEYIDASEYVMSHHLM